MPSARRHGRLAKRPRPRNALLARAAGPLRAARPSAAARDGGHEFGHLLRFAALVEHRRHLPETARAPF
jgi:hypothetical protein